MDFTDPSKHLTKFYFLVVVQVFNNHVGEKSSLIQWLRLRLEGGADKVSAIVIFNVVVILIVYMVFYVFVDGFLVF